MTNRPLSRSWAGVTRISSRSCLASGVSYRTLALHVCRRCIHNRRNYNPTRNALPSPRILNMVDCGFSVNTSLYSPKHTCSLTRGSNFLIFTMGQWRSYYSSSSSPRGTALSRSSRRWDPLATSRSGCDSDTSNPWSSWSRRFSGLRISDRIFPSPVVRDSRMFLTPREESLGERQVCLLETDYWSCSR